MTHVDGAKMRRLREAAGFTRETFIIRAHELGYDLTSRTVAALETGEGGGDARISTVRAVSAVLGVRIEDLLVDDAA